MNSGSIFRSALLRWTAFVLAVLFVLVALYLWRFNPLAIGRPKDRELIAIFRDHREAFERLRTMAIEDSGAIAYLSKDSLKKSTLSEARQNEYLSLLSGVRRNLTVGAGSHQVTFHFSGGGVGLAIARSWTEGITYLPTGYEKGCVIVKSLDGLGTHNDGVYLVPIEGNWYLVYSNLD
jgi:hypothetical protein